MEPHRPADVYEVVLSKITPEVDMYNTSSNRYIIPFLVSILACILLTMFGLINNWNMGTKMALVGAVVLGAAFTWKGWKTVNEARAKYYYRKDALITAFGEPLNNSPEWFPTVLTHKAEMITVSGVSFLRLQTLRGEYVLGLPTRETEILNVHYWTTLGRGTVIAIKAPTEGDEPAASAVAVCNVDVSDMTEVTIHVVEKTILRSKSS